MIISFDKVYERDIDLYVINNFCNDNSFLDLFLRKIDKKGYKVISAESSLADKDGESDITIVLENKNNKIGLLIEDKIDAIAMPNQSGRYVKRGDKGIKDGKYNEYYIFIIAPNDYLNTNQEAKKYPNKISYEELLSSTNDKYGKALFQKAIEIKKKGYSPIEDKKTTKFWGDFYNYIEINYPKVDIYKQKGPRSGDKPGWPRIRTGDKRAYIMYKSDRGQLDLTFNDFGEHVNIFHNYMDKLLLDKMSIHRTQKSMAVRMSVPKTDFHQTFKEYEQEIKEVMDKTMILLNFFWRLDVDELYSLIEKTKI